MSRSLICIAAVLFFVGAVVYSQQTQNLELLPVQGSVSMLAGAGGNITIQSGKDGILLVDTGSPAMSDKVIQAIRNFAKRQITYVVNTSDAPDHLGGNEAVAKIGRPLAIARAAQASVFIIAFNTILDRLSVPDIKPPIGERGWPNDTYSVPLKNLSFNGEAVQIFHQPATTDGNSIVVFRHSDVVSTGDLFDPTEYPIIDVKKGGSLQGVVEGLNRLRQIVIPADHMEGGTMVVPGHGRICDAGDLDIYQQMVTIVRDRLQDMIKRGMTLEQIKAARPTRDYDPIYGKNTGNWTTDMFIEAAYKSLTAKTDPVRSDKSN